MSFHTALYSAVSELCTGLLRNVLPEAVRTSSAINYRPMRGVSLEIQGMESGAQSILHPGGAVCPHHAPAPPLRQVASPAGSEVSLSHQNGSWCLLPMMILRTLGKN